MATKKIEMQYDLRQNSNENNKAYGKWFPQAIRHSTLDLDGLCDHIADHGSIYTQDVVTGVLKKFISCITELVSQGTGVKLNGLGTFYPTMEATGAQSAVGYNIYEHLEGVHIRFLPDDSNRAALTSRQFIQKCSFDQRMIFDMYGVPKRVVNGELVNYGDDEEDEGGDGD